MRSLFAIGLACLAFCACDAADTIPECPQPELGAWRSLNECGVTVGDDTAAICAVGVDKYDVNCRIAASHILCLSRCP